MKEVIWYKTTERMPDNSGNYLCVTNDSLTMVCHLANNGWWSKVPDAKYHGHMGSKVTIDSKQVEREVVWWTDLPSNIPFMASSSYYISTYNNTLLSHTNSIMGRKTI